MDSSKSEIVDPAVPPLSASVSASTSQHQTFLALLLVAVALGLAAKYLFPLRFRSGFEGPDVLTLNGSLTLLAAISAVIVMHEAGHLIAAVLVQFEVLGIALGPFRAVRSNGIWTVRLSLRTLLSGSVSAVPRTTECWRGRMLIVVASGPLATLATGLTAATLLLSNLSGGWTNTFIAAVVQLSAFIFVLGLIPNSRYARVRNDARLLLVLASDSQQAREILLYHLLTRLDLAGVRPRDYPEPLMRELAQTQGRPDLMLFSAHKIAAWALDRGKLSTADAWDQRCLALSEVCQHPSRNVALASSACLDVLTRNLLMDARNKFAEVDWHSLSPLWLMHRSRAAYHLTTGNVPECLAEISRAQYALPRHLAIYAFEHSLLSRLHQKAINLEPCAPIGRSAAA